VRIVVTGLSGNLGTALLRRLADGGAEHDLLGVCRRPPAPREPYDRARWAALDLASPTAAAALRPLLDGVDAVVHLAWLFQPSHDVGYLERTGVGGTRAVLQACVEAGVPHLVHVSSLGVYSPGPSDVAGPRVSENWPRDGIASHAYSLHKAWAERVLDDHPADRAPIVTRLRPALVLQRRAAGALLRYGVPGWVPAAALRLLPVLPLDRALVVQAVHADDVAAAVDAALARRPGGAFNLAAEPPITADDLASAFGARLLPVPRPLLRALVALTWHARLQPLDPGWLDLAFTTPLMDSGRARRDLDWAPAVGSLDALRELVAALTSAAGDDASPVLRRRTVPGAARDLIRRGPVGTRPRS
jgi:nucleoside-diphosphate-sugar epimerase